MRLSYRNDRNKFKIKKYPDKYPRNVEFRKVLKVPSIIIVALCCITSACTPRPTYTHINVNELNFSKGQYEQKNVLVYGYLKAQNNGENYSLHTNKESFLIRGSIEGVFIKTEKYLNDCDGFFVLVKGISQSEGRLSKSISLESLLIFEEVPSLKNNEIPTIEEVKKCDASFR